MANREGEFLDLKSQNGGRWQRNLLLDPSPEPLLQPSGRGRQPGTEASAGCGLPARPDPEDTQEAAPGSTGGGPRPRLSVPRA